jgi:hypothetical protein
MNDFRALGDPEFEISRRGYDREQVDSHLAEIRAELTRLQGLLTESAGEPSDGSYPEPVQAELDRVSAEVESIIGAAREAAEGLRTRAAAEASKWREEADGDARRWRAEAEEESGRLRADAASSSERLLTEAQEESDKRRTDADAYAARVREEADAYAQQTRQVAESEASQVKEEADAYAARVTGSVDDYAASTRETADTEAAETRTAAQSDATAWRSDAESDSRRIRDEADAYAQEVRTTVAAEADRVTEEAGAAALEARTSAEEYAAALRQSADAETTRQRYDAQTAAETARASVWDEATSILDSVAREAIEVRDRGETEALAIIADGEQQSHRLVSQARQSSEEQRRAARIEADRLIGDAQAQHDEIIETANRAAAAAQERAQALERRREELMGQLEKTQEAMRTLEEELETRRETMREVPLDSSTVKVVPHPEAEELAGVRIIPSAPAVSSHPSAPPVTAEEIMDEVRSLRQQREAAEPEAPSPELASADADADTAEEIVPDGEEEQVAPVRDIDALFANLRESDPEPADEAKPLARPSTDVDPDQLRERLLLPLQNRAHREVKRQLTEQQNVALEQIRLAAADWNPDPAIHDAAFSPALTELVLESAGAGYLAARELGARDEDPPALSVDDVDTPTTEFAADLTATVAAALDRSRSAGETSRKVSAAASKVYRSWRTDSAEHRLREMSEVAYADALRTALRAEGYEDTEWALGDWAAARHAS